VGKLGGFKMFKKFLKRKEALTWKVPFKGTIKPITEAPDPVFAQKIMGDGFCIDPEEGAMFSPVKGVVSSIFPTKHAIGITSENENEIILHVGVDTVNLNGEGFELYVSEGDTVNAGDKILEVDIERIKDKVPSLTTVVAITNIGEKTVELSKFGAVTEGESITLTLV